MSKAKFFRKIQDGDTRSNQLQSNVEAAVGSLLRNQLLDGRIVSDVALVSGNTKIEHKLARSIKGYIVIKKSNAATIYDSADDDKFLTLNASANVTVSLYIF